MKKIMMAMLPICCVILGAVFFWLNGKDDTTPPVITFPDDTVEYKEGEDTSILLEGVTAMDAVDGDVSDTLMVKSVIPMKDETTATVLYCAKDKKNNVASASREVSYMPEGGVLWLLESEGETEEETETEVTAVKMVAINDCNVRTEANTDSEVLGVLDIGDTIMKTGETDDGWTQVDYEEKNAYVKSEYLSVAEEETE